MEESPMFSDDDEEAETPRTHIQQFLTNVATDPPHSMSSKRKRWSQSFVKTPDKRVKGKEKNLLRLSTSLPSPGSLITPKTNLQHLLLGSGTAKTPLDRRVASVRSTRLSSKSMLQQAPLGWGQKVSLSPLYTSSPSTTSNRFDVDSPARAFKKPQHHSHRSFKIPDLPANSVLNNRGRDQDVNCEDDGGVQCDVDANLGGQDDADTSHLVEQQNSPFMSSSNDSILKQMSKSIQMEKAKKIYELKVSSTEEESDHDHSLATKLKTNRKFTTPNKSKTPNKRMSSSLRRSTNKSHLEGSEQRQKTIMNIDTNASMFSRQGHGTPSKDDMYDDDGDPSHFHSLSSSKRLFDSISEHEETSTVPKSQSKNVTSTKQRKGSQMETPFQIESSPRIVSSLSAMVNKVETKRWSRGKEGDVPDGGNQPVISSNVSMSTSYSDESPGPGKEASKHWEETSGKAAAANTSMLKSSQAITPVRIQPLTRTLSTSPRLHDRPPNVGDSQNIENTLRATRHSPRHGTSRHSPRHGTPSPRHGTSRHSPRHGTPSPRHGTSRHSPRHGTSRHSPRHGTSRHSPRHGTSRSETRRGTRSAHNVMADRASGTEMQISLNDLLNESNPSSSTPFKRSKSVFSSTRMQAFKGSDLPRDKSMAIGDLSPIRPVEGDAISPDIESPAGYVKGKRSTSKSLSTPTSKNNMHPDDDHGAEDDYEGDTNNSTPMKTPFIDMNKQPSPLSRLSKTFDRPSKAVQAFTKSKQPVSKKTKPVAASAKRKSTAQSSVIPMKLIKAMAELYSPMKIDKEALEELGNITQKFMANTLEAAECYSQHAGRKTITEADFVLMMKKQRLMKNKEDLYDLIRKYLAMELRCKLIPCFPSQW